MKERWEAWNRAIAAGLMEEGAETKYRFTPHGKVLSVAVGKSGQILANGERLAPSFAEQLRGEMPFLDGMVTFYENNQAASCGLEGGTEDGVAALEPPPAAGAAALRWWVSRPGGFPRATGTVPSPAEGVGQACGGKSSSRRSFCRAPSPWTRRRSEISRLSRSWPARTLPMPGSDSSSRFT